MRFRGTKPPESEFRAQPQIYYTKTLAVGEWHERAERENQHVHVLGKHLHFSIPALSRASTLINTYLHEIVITELEKCAPASLSSSAFFLWRGAEVKSDYGPRPPQNLWAIAKHPKKKTCQTTPNARRR